MIRITDYELEYDYDAEVDDVLVDPLEALTALEKQAPEVLREWACDNDDHNIHARPWGYYEILAEGPGCKVKRLVIDPGKRTSLQWHEKREETWFPVEGSGELERGNLNMFSYDASLVSGFNVGRRMKHRITNTGTEPLVIIEVQTYDEADPSTEDDIHRVEDDWGRGE